MFDHVAIAVADLAASERFYRTVLSVLGAEPSHTDTELVEWEDWDIGATDREHPVTRGPQVGLRAPSRETVDAFWRAGIEAGYRDDGAPGARSPRHRRPGHSHRRLLQTGRRGPAAVLAAPGARQIATGPSRSRRARHTDLG